MSTSAETPSALAVFSVTEVARLFGLSESRIRYWDQTGLISPSHRQNGKRLYSFRDLVGVKTLKELLDAGASLQRIRRCLEQLRAQLPGPADPAGALLRLRVVCRGDLLVVTGAEGPYEAESGQVLFEFGVEALSAELALVVPLPLGTQLAGPAAGPVAEEAAGGGAASPAEGVASDPASASREPATAHDWFVLARGLHAEPGQEERAAAAYGRALELDPGLAAAHTNLGNLHMLAGDSAAALLHYQQALTLDADQPEARYNRARLLEEQGDLEAAAREYRQVLLRDPAFADAHFNLAQVLERSGQPRGALVHFHAYLELCPEGEAAEQALARLERFVRAAS
jgi:DNA-binding transcriptional MerR regulator/Tfp pilus assembly protein PilF